MLQPSFELDGTSVVAIAGVGADASAVGTARTGAGENIALQSSITGSTPKPNMSTAITILVFRVVLSRLSAGYTAMHTGSAPRAARDGPAAVAVGGTPSLKQAARIVFADNDDDDDRL